MTSTSTSRHLLSGRRLAVSAAAVIAATAVPTSIGALGAGAAELAAAPTQTRVAAAQIRGMRAVVTATRTSKYRATVRLNVQTRRPAGWHNAGTVVVGKPRGWFWYVTSGPGAVCAFTVTGTPARTVDLRLLETPSIGCETSTHHYRVEQGQLVGG